jgi:RNA polymerase sigma-70 factor (ECF subfamily)
VSARRGEDSPREARHSLPASDRVEQLAAAYQAARPRLVRVAYAVLGVHSEAEDVVADVWLRLAAADERDPIRDVDAWATVAVARAALDALRSARMRRESYVGPWLPEPVVTDSDPADRVTLDDAVSFALLVVLETLTPAERTAWVLHDLFGLPFAEIAPVVGRSADAVRQLASRARVHVRSQTPRVAVDPSEHDRVVGEFLRAAAGGGLPALVATLDPEVVLTSDGGGVVSAARRPVLGADRVARFLLGIAGKAGPNDRIAPLTVNGAAGLGLYQGADLSAVLSLVVTNGRVARIDLIRAPAKLANVGARGLDVQPD